MATYGPQVKKKVDMWTQKGYVFAMNDRMKTELVKMRLTTAEKAGFQTAADLAGVSLSSWMRERLRITAIRELEGAGRSVPFVPQVSLRSRADG